MMCKDCGRVDGLKILLDRKEFLCKRCLARENGCKHLRSKIYKNFDTGEYYKICKTCALQEDI